MRGKVGWVVVVLVAVLSVEGVVGEERPQLKRGSYSERVDSFLGSKYEWIEYSFQFDQDLYLNEPFVCVNAENSCPKWEDCKPCDWSHPGGDSCWDEDCCEPEIPVAQKEIWCSTSPTLHPYTTLQVDQKSETFKLDAEQTQYFRFFLGEEVSCRPVMVAVRSIYGNHQFFLSSVLPEPSYDGAYTEPYSVIYRQNQWSFAQSITNICPGTSIYTPGTYAIAIAAFEPTSFYIEIRPSPMAFPLPLPEEKVSCDSVPEEVYEVSASNGRQVLCLEDGVTTRFDSRESGFDDMFDVVLPIPAGCHGVSVGVQNYVSAFTDHDLNCIRLNDNKRIQYWGDYNSALAAWRTTDDTLSFFGCFPDTTYVHCSILPWELGEAGVIFSTVSPFLRSPIGSLPPAVLSSQIGVGSIHVMRSDALACGDFHLWCSSWVAPAFSSPLVFWPPPAISSILPEHYDPLPFEFVHEEARSDTIIFVDTTIRADTRYGWREYQYHSTFLFLFFSNKDGLPVELPPSKNPNPLAKNSSLLGFIPNIQFQDLKKRGRECGTNEFHAHEALVDDLITSVGDSSSFLSPVALPYYVEMFNAREIYGDCLESAISAFPVENRTMIRSGLSCFYETQDPEWALDPCCNLVLQSTQCCQFKTVPEETSVRAFIQQDDIVCRSEIECTESYFVDFLRAYNDQFDGIIGCPSQTPLEKKRYLDGLQQTELEGMRLCLTNVGYGGIDGAQFMGSPCNDDSDCNVGCNKDEGICLAGTLEDMENQFVRCWIEQMSSFVEDHIRRKVFTPKEALAPRYSDKFFFALKDHATKLDCLSPTHPLDFTQRTHTTLRDTNFAVELPICPGGELCVFDNAPFNSSVIVHDDLSRLRERVIASEEKCMIAGECGGCLEEGVCVSCVEIGGRSEKCEVQEGVGREECERKGACVYPNGEVEYGLTEEECNAIQGECSLCLRDSCTSWKSGGVCVLSDLTSEGDCSGQGIWDVESSTCQAPTGDQTQDKCQDAGFTWESCGNYDLDECSTDSPLKSYSGCQWSSSLSSACRNKELCESGGRCSDSHLLFPLEGGGRGGCSFAGTVIEAGTPPDILEAADINYKGSSIGYMRRGVLSEEQCKKEEGTNVWLKEALTEDECVREACYLPALRFTLGFYFGEEDCECMGGRYKSATRWETGRWKEPKFAPFRWNEQPQSPKYEWTEALYFETMVGWMVDSVQERATTITVSSLSCERNFTSSTLDWIVCNCLSSSTNECLVSSAPRVATGRVCTGLATNLSAPSSRLIFSEDSVSEGCAEVELGFLSIDGFTYLRKRPSIAVQFEKPQTTGLVVNEKGATVGSLLGDGVQISFLFESFHKERIKMINHFEVCLNQHIQDGEVGPDSDRFGESDLSGLRFGELGDEVTDFAVLQSDGTLKVLYMDLQPDMISGYLYWCGNVTEVEKLVAEGGGGGDSCTLFPVSRMKNAADQDVHSDQAKILAYVLAGFFLALLVFYTCLLINNLISFHTLLGMVVPVLFVLLCVFRAAFFLMWAQGEFEDDGVAEYIVFETPTFLLLVLLLVLISCWKSISKKKSHFEKISHTREIFLTVCVVFLYISIVVASVVIYKSIDEKESACPGRAPADSSELEDALNTLSIVYMSLVTFFTFMLAGVLFFEARGILRMVSKGFLMAIIYIPTSRFTFVFLIFFLVRCILFLILYTADITSDIFVFILLMVCEVIPCMALWVEVFIVAFAPDTTSDSGSVFGSQSTQPAHSSSPKFSTNKKGSTPIPSSQQGSFSLSQAF